MKRAGRGKDKQQVKTEARSAEKPCTWGLHLLCASGPPPSPSPFTNSVLFACFSSSFRSNSCAKRTPLPPIVIRTLHVSSLDYTSGPELSTSRVSPPCSLSFSAFQHQHSGHALPVGRNVSCSLPCLVSSLQRSEPRHPESLLGFIAEAFLWKLLRLILYKRGA